MTLRLLLGCAIATLIQGCAPTCTQVCKKVLNDCELDSQRVALDECTASCSTQESLYATWRNDHLQQLFDDHKRCIRRSSCEELAAGACYDGYEELFTFDPDKTLPAGTSAAVD